MWVKMCSKEFGITPRKIGSDLTPKDQRKWTAIIVIWIFKLANQLTAFWNNLLALYTSRTLWHSKYEWFKYNLQHYLPWWMFFLSQSVHKQILCLTREISELHINPPTKSPVQPLIRVTMLWSYILPVSLSTQELIPQLGSHMCWCRNTSHAQVCKQSYLKGGLRGVWHKEWETTRNTVHLSRNASDFISHTSLALTSWLHLPTWIVSWALSCSCQSSD